MNRALLALLLAISSAASAHSSYEWTQEQPASKSYRWEQVADMKQVTQAKAEAFTVQQDDGICVVYSTMSEWEAKERYINPRDGLPIFFHEMKHCRGLRHTIKES